MKWERGIWDSESGPLEQSTEIIVGSPSWSEQQEEGHDLGREVDVVEEGSPRLPVRRKGDGCLWGSGG